MTLYTGITKLNNRSYALLDKGTIMKATTLAEALRPIAAKMPKVVREYEVLRIAATLSGKDPKKATEVARKEVLRWAQKRSGGFLPQESWAFENFEYLSGGRNSVGVRLNNNTADVWAIRADDPDKKVAGRIWSTEVVVGSMFLQPPRFSARLLVSTTEENLDIEPHTPGFVQQVAESVGLRCADMDLTPIPWIIRDTWEAEQLVDFLVDPTRKKPVFVLTVPENSTNPETPLIDANTLARATLGIAHVVILPAIYTWILTDGVGKQRSVFGGAVRTYLSGFSEETSPYNHRLVLAEHLFHPDGAAQCLRWMRSLAASESLRQTRLGKDVLSFSSIRSASLAFEQETLEVSGASVDEQLKAAKARIKALEEQTENDNKTLDFFSSEHDAAEARANTAEDQLRSSTFYIQTLLDQIKSSGTDVDEKLVLPTAWPEIINWCDANLAGRLTLAPLARRNVKKTIFEDISLVARCLLWLASSCRERHLSGGDGTLREEIVEDGIRNAHCGSDQFDLDWQGQRYTADWHIKNGGNTRDPRRCLRIYYFWDPSSQQIVVADMPEHRVTEAT